MSNRSVSQPGDSNPESDGINLGRLITFDDEDPRRALFDLTERIVRQALYADEGEAQYLDWDLIADAYDALVKLARQAAYGEVS